MTTVTGGNDGAVKGRVPAGSFLVAALLLTLALLTPAAWGACGGIYGTVTDSKGGDVAGVTVNIYHLNHTLAGSATTYYDGTYSFDGLPPGSYKVEFNPQSVTDTTVSYLGQWNDGSTAFTDAPPVTVGTATAIVNATLKNGGSISGTVTGTTVPGGLKDAAVTVHDATGEALREATTASNGTYRITALPAGTYSVCFSRDAQGCSGSTCTHNKTVTVGTSTTVNAVLPTGTINGTVRTRDTGAPLVWSAVTVYDAVTGVQIGTAMTDLKGAYHFYGLAPGGYKVRFGSSYSEYVSAWYDDRFSLATADRISLADGETVTVDASLTAGGTISGTVTEKGSGLGMYGVQVFAYDSISGEQVASSASGSDSRYTLKGLRTGQSYQLRFSHPDYAGQWYDGKSDRSSANPVAVASTSPVTGIDAALVKSVAVCDNTGGVTGTLLYPCGDPAQFETVTVFDAAGSLISASATDYYGGYTVTCLPAGSYTIVLRTADPSGYIAVANATVTAPGITALPAATLDFGGSISGRVVNASGQGVAQADVRVYDDAGNSVGFGATTDIGGQYTAEGLPSGRYTVQATHAGCSGSESGWYGSKKPVTVTAPSGFDGIDITVRAPLTVTTNAGDGGTITATTTVDYGGSVTVTAAATTGYHIATVLVDGVSQTVTDPKSFSHTFANVTADHTVSATFTIDTLAVTTSAGANGTITPTATVPYGGNATITVTPDLNYHIATVLVDGVSQTITDPKAFSHTFTNVTAGHAVYAIFAEDTRSVSVSVTGTGSGRITSTPSGIDCVSGSAGLCSAPFAVTSSVVLTPTASSDSLFVNWSGGCSGAGSCTFAPGVTPLSVTASFAPLSATVKRGDSYYSHSIVDAYLTAADGSTIQARTNSTPESITLDRVPTLSVTLIGGYNSTFSSVTGLTTVKGPFTVKTGKVTVANIVIR